MLSATTKGICGHGVKKSLHTYVQYTYICVRSVTGRSVNGFIKSVFVVVTIAKKNYFFSSFSSRTRFFSLCHYLSLPTPLTLSLFHSLSLFPFTLSYYSTSLSSSSTSSSSSSSSFSFFFFAGGRANADYMRGRNIISSGAASQECARAVFGERIIDFSRMPINYVRGRPFPCRRT